MLRTQFSPAGTVAGEVAYRAALPDAPPPVVGRAPAALAATVRRPPAEPAGLTG